MEKPWGDGGLILTPLWRHLTKVLKRIHLISRVSAGVRIRDMIKFILVREKTPRAKIIICIYCTGFTVKGGIHSFCSNTANKYLIHRRQLFLQILWNYLIFEGFLKFYLWLSSLQHKSVEFCDVRNKVGKYVSKRSVLFCLVQELLTNEFLN